MHRTKSDQTSYDKMGKQIFATLLTINFNSLLLSTYCRIICCNEIMGNVTKFFTGKFLYPNQQSLLMAFYIQPLFVTNRPMYMS